MPYVRWIVFLWMGFIALSVYAGPSFAIREGVHYRVVLSLARPVPTDKVEVMEFFSYGCPHCYHFEPTLQAWEQTFKKQVDLVRVPVVFQPAWRKYAQAFYAAELFNKLAGMHADFYKAIHEEGRYLIDPQDLGHFFVQHGVERDQFEKTFESFGVHTKVEVALKMALDYQVTSVPTFVVNQKYIVQPVTAGGYDKMLEVLDYLVQKEYRRKNSTPLAVDVQKSSK